MRVTVVITDDDGEIFEGELELKPKKARGKSKTKVRVQKSDKKHPTTLTGRILELKEDNFFKKPKTAHEVKKELEIRTFHHAIRPIMVALMTRVRKGVLRRIKEKEGKKEIYKYVNP